MKIQEALTQLRKVKPNQYDDGTLVRWLAALDGKIYNDIIVWHEQPKAHEPEEENGEAPVPQIYDGFRAYDPVDDMETELLVNAPYDDLYIKYLGTQVDYHNAEWARYNNGMMMFNMALSEFADHYNRTHMPKQDNYVSI